MADLPMQLSGARILVTNDDGIFAPGIKVLERIARAFSKDVWVVAPETEQSAASHSLTLRRPLQVRKMAAKRYAVDGTPTDCVLVAQRKLLLEKPADIILSGINRGANLGEDVSYSGTVAAAKEGASLGIPSIAFSQVYAQADTIHWATAERYGVEVLKSLQSFSWRKGTLINVNFPPCPPEEVTAVRAGPQGFREADVELIDYESPGGRPYIWIGDFANDRAIGRGTDLSIIEDKAVSVTPLHLEMTDKSSLKAIKELLS